MDNRINMFFYSRKCNKCRQIYKLLVDEDMIKYFKSICIDDLRRTQIPKGITMVPTLITNLIPKPLVGDEIFRWIQGTRFIKLQKIAAQQEIVKRNMIRAAMINKKGNIGYNVEEMNGYSDDYAYTNTDQAQAKSFMGCGDEKKNAIFTAAETQQKIGKHGLEKAIKTQETNRKQQDTFNDQFYKKNQAIAVLNEIDNQANLN